MRDNGTARSGTILFEVVVGLTILAIAGIAWVTLLAQTQMSIAQMRARDVRLRVANDLLERHRLLDHHELDARLGTTRIGAFTISVSAITPQLYSLVARDTGAQAVLLWTTVYTREATDSVQ